MAIGLDCVAAKSGFTQAGLGRQQKSFADGTVDFGQEQSCMVWVQTGEQQVSCCLQEVQEGTQAAEREVSCCLQGVQEGVQAVEREVSCCLQGVQEGVGVQAVEREVSCCLQGVQEGIQAAEREVSCCLQGVQEEEQAVPCLGDELTV